MTQALFRLLGKVGAKTLAVFADDPGDAHRAVEYLRAEAPGLPIHLFVSAPPLPETGALCESVVVRGNPVALFIAAQRALWPRQVALSAGAWTGSRGRWGTKLAPLLTPPFRAVLLNEQGDFLAGSPGAIARHAAWRVPLLVQSAGVRLIYAVRRAYAPLRDTARTSVSFVSANALRVTGALLRVTGYPHRAHFGSLHGGQFLHVQPACSSPSGISVFTQTGDTWDGAAFEQFARSSTARWILWHRAGRPPDSTRSLTPLFDRAHTFAAATSAHFRGWKGAMFSTAPFRALRPGEAAETLAPLPETVLIDRAKLLVLDIPRCRFSSTAWMLLYWQAAAAGWRSYAVGRNAGATEEPDFPVHEAGFLLQLLAHPALRRLAPRTPALSRGNIAFSPALALQATPRRKPRVLIVTPFLPFPLSHGGAVRIYNLCRALCDRVDFILAAVREKDEIVDYARLGEIFREVYAVDLDERPEARPEDPGPVAHYRSTALPALIGRICREFEPDVLQVEYTQMAAYRDCAPNIPAVLVEHDVTFSLYRQLAEAEQTPAAEAEYQRWLRFERAWLGAYDAVWNVSDDDRDLTIEESARSRESTWTIANGVDIDRYRPSVAPTEPEVLFIGSFRHLPNAIAFDKLAHEVMPRVWQSAPEARLRVVAGPRYEEFWLRYLETNPRPALDCRIELHGFTEDLRPLYQSAAVVTAPLAVSAGTNIKVLEAMACGKAIVTTSTGCQGLGMRNAEEALICDDWSRFGDAVAWLLRDPALRRRMGAAARKLAEDRFSWTAIAERAWTSYRLLIDSTEASRESAVTVRK